MGWRAEFPAVNRVSDRLRKAMRAEYHEALPDVERARRPGVALPLAPAPRRDGHFQDGM